MARTVVATLGFIVLLAGACAQPSRSIEAKLGPDAGADEERQQPDARADAEVDAAPASDLPHTDAATPNDVPAEAPTIKDEPKPIAEVPTTHIDDHVPAIGQPAEHTPTPHTLPALPHPREGACAFEPPAPLTGTLDNTKCPDGIWQGDISLASDADVESVRGCIRVRGKLEIHASNITSIAALKALRVIEGELHVTTDPVCSATSETCSLPASPLTNLDGLDALRCVGAELSIAGQAQHPIGIDALHSLVEVGGSLSLSTIAASSDALASLRRIWKDASFDRTLSLPHLEAVYGNYRVGYSELTSADFYLGCTGSNYCRDGVLGCSLTVVSASQIQQLSNCEIAIGSLSVTGEAIAHLSALSKLRQVLGTLSLRSDGNLTAVSNVTRLEGLQSLDTVGNLSLVDLPALTTLDGIVHASLRQLRTVDLGDALAVGTPGSLELRHLPQLQNVAGLGSAAALRQVTIDDCDALVDLSGLESLQNVSGLRLEGNAGLLSLVGLSQLHTLGQIELISDPNLVDISALAGLQSLSLRVYDLLYLRDFLPLRNVSLVNVHILNMPSLQTLAGLEGLGQSARWIDVQNNPVLEDIGALGELRTAWRIEIRGNVGLRSIQALDGLQTVTDSSEIYNNALVPQCAVDALHARIPLLEGTQNNQEATCTTPVTSP